MELEIVQLEPNQKISAEFFVYMELVWDGVLDYLEECFEDKERVLISGADCTVRKVAEGKSNYLCRNLKWEAYIDVCADEMCTDQILLMIDQSLAAAEKLNVKSLAIPVNMDLIAFGDDDIRDHLLKSGVRYSIKHPECKIIFYQECGLYAPINLEEFRRKVNIFTIFETETDQVVMIQKVAELMGIQIDREKINSSIGKGNGQDKNLLSKENSSAERTPQKKVYDGSLELDAFIKKYREMSLDQWFNKMLDEREIKASDVYKKAGVSKQAYSRLRQYDYDDKSKKKMKSQKYNTILTLLALEPPYEEFLEKLSMRSFALSDCEETDLVIRWSLLNGKYDVDKLNEVLYERELEPLGNVKE